MPHAPDKRDGIPEVKSVTETEHLSLRVSQVHDPLTKIKKVVAEKETDVCLLGHKKASRASILTCREYCIAG